MFTSAELMRIVEKMGIFPIVSGPIDISLIEPLAGSEVRIYCDSGRVKHLGTLKLRGEDIILSSPGLLGVKAHLMFKLAT